MKLIDERYEVHIPDTNEVLPDRNPSVSKVKERMEELPEQLCSALVSLTKVPIGWLPYRQRIALAYVLDALP